MRNIDFFDRINNTLKETNNGFSVVLPVTQLEIDIFLSDEFYNSLQSELGLANAIYDMFYEINLNTLYINFIETY